MRYFADCLTEQEVKLAYKAWAFKLHPDLNPDIDRGEFQELTRQYGEAVGKAETVDDGWWEWDESAPGLLNPKAKIRMVIAFSGSYIGLETLDLAVCFVINHLTSGEIAELKKRSHAGTVANREIELTAAEFCQFWDKKIQLSRKKKNAKKRNGSPNSLSGTR